MKLATDWNDVEYESTSQIGKLDGSVQQSEARPLILLPSDFTEITESAEALGEQLADAGYYTRADQFARINAREIELINPNQARSIFETVGVLAVKRPDKDGNLIDTPRRCSETNARAIVEADSFRDALPPINAITHCPVLLYDGRVVTGYDTDTGVYAMGNPPEDVPLADAVSMLLGLLDDFNFSTDADRSRAVAAMLIPAMVNGQLLGPDKRVPGFAFEADASQSGKGYALRMNALIYDTTPATVSQRKNGVGGIEESIGKHLIAGAPIIALDNLRGKVDIPWLEAAHTEPSIDARIPYSKSVSVDPRRTCFCLTSNRSELTPDLANRYLFVRINKRPDDYQFRKFAEGDLIEHVRANQPRYLGAVYAVLQHWIEQGRPGDPDGRHDMRAWAGAAVWITTKIFNLPDPLVGHREIQRRTANRSANWLRDVCLAVSAADRLGRELRAHDLIDILVDAEVEIPGLGLHDDPEDEHTRNKLLRGVGRRLSSLFKKANDTRIECDRFEVERVEGIPDIYGNGRPIISHIITRT